MAIDEGSYRPQQNIAFDTCPVHQLWNAYSPFRSVPETQLQTIDGISAKSALT